MAIKNEKIASDVLTAVGGKANITSVTHCITRLRFNLKDMNLPNQEEIQKIPGVLGVVVSGGQFQVIIGQNVDKVYAILCQETGLEMQAAIDENLDKVNEPLTPKKIGSNILNYISGSVIPIIPAMMGCAMLRVIAQVLGPDMLNVIGTESDLYVLFDLIGDVAVYFFPIFLGFNAAKILGTNQMMGALMGAILLDPTLMEMANSGTSFTVYGIPAYLQDYSSTLLPVLLTVFVMSYVEKGVRRIVPDSLRIVFHPLLTVVIMLPLELCFLAPAGYYMGTLICDALLWFSSATGALGVAVLGAAWPFLVMTGMHTAIIPNIAMLILTAGYDTLWLPAVAGNPMAVTGMCLGMALATRNKDERTSCFTYAISQIIGGVGEPALYGVGMKYKKPFIGLAVGCFCSGLYSGIMGVTAYVLAGASNFLILTVFLGGSSANFVNAVISSVIGCVVAAVITYILCREKKPA